MLRGLLNRRVLIPVLVLVVLVGSYGGYRVWRHYHVSTGTVARATTRQLTLDGQAALVIAAQRARGPRPVAILAHGYGIDERVAVETKAIPFTQRLVDAGWVVGSSAAHGNAWGSPTSQQDYLRLLGWVRQHYQVSGVVLVGFSMGAIPTLDLAAAGKVPGLRGWVGVSAITDLAKLDADPKWTHTIDSALPKAEQQEVDPMGIPPAKLAGLPITLYTSPAGDDIAPPGKQVQPFVAHLAGAAKVRVVDCKGGHVAADCYRAGDILALAG